MKTHKWILSKYGNYVAKQPEDSNQYIICFNPDLQTEIIMKMSI